MYVLDFLLGLMAALVASILFSTRLGRIKLWQTFLIFFALIVITAWAGGRWVFPIGPFVSGGWILFLIVAALVFAFLLAFAAYRHKRKRAESRS